MIEGLQEPPLEFYRDVEAAVIRRSVPDTKFERIEYKEGGAFSGLRQYLRIRRHREVFDVCAAPFGNGCFVSWWLAEVRPELPTIASILIVFGYLAVLGTFANEFGVFRGPILFLLLIPLILFAVKGMGTPAADDFILMLPLIGKFYERFFSPITYYRIDTSEMFQSVVRRAVDEVVDQLTTAKGLRALTELERKPVMRDFFRK